MDLRSIYEAVGGNYDDCISRLMTEDRMKKYLGKFVASPEYQDMINAFESKDYEVAFRSSHSLKGMCANLGLTKLGQSASELCETVRNGAPTIDISGLLDEVKKDYSNTVDFLQMI